jgi:hypothetical protein
VARNYYLKPTPEKKPDADLARVWRYLDKIPGAISGSGGHNQTFNVALKLVCHFHLSRNDALRALDYYNQRCEPKWSAKELEHKVNDALKHA